MAKAVWYTEEVYRGYDICVLDGVEGYFVEFEGYEFNFPDLDDAKLFIDVELYDEEG
jgi:hypothetical protein